VAKRSKTELIQPQSPTAESDAAGSPLSGIAQDSAAGGGVLDDVAREIRSRLTRAGGSAIERIILHGSRAAGRARWNSDYDVLVVMRDPVDDCVAEALRLSELFCDFDHPVDIQVWGAEEFEECRAVPATIAYPADQHGYALHPFT
jgi:predicted nucleotidyltransferase